MFWIQAGCPRLHPEFLADPKPVYDLGELVSSAYTYWTEDVIFCIEHQLYRLAYADFSSWIQELVPFLDGIRRGEGGHTSLYDQSGFDSEWMVRLEGERLHVHVRWDPHGAFTDMDFTVNRGHFLREWKEPLMRVRQDLAPFADLIENPEHWEDLVRFTDAVEGRGMLYGGTLEWDLPEA